MTNPLLQTLERTTNPLLTKVRMPGRRVALPSGASIYTNGEVSDEILQTGEVEVHPINTINEIRLRSPDLLFSGHAIEQVIKECVPGVNKPLELLAKDIDAIMLWLRIASYGASFGIKTKHTCSHAASHEYEIDLERVAAQGKYLTKQDFETLYKFELPNGQLVQLRPHRFNFVVSLYQKSRSIDQRQEANVDDAIDLVMSNLNEIIYSVDGVTDRTLIQEWIMSCPSTWIEDMISYNDKVNDWGFSLKSKVQCRDCGEIYEVIVPLNPVTFFSK